MAKIIFPTDEENGVQSKRGAHFGKAQFYTIVTITNEEVESVEIVKNPGHAGGACGGAVTNILKLNPDALVVSGIGGRPAQGFHDAGLELYFDASSPTVIDSVNLFIAGKLKQIQGVGTCSTH